MEDEMTDETKKADAQAAGTPIVKEAEKQEAILNALQSVLDPEIGLSVIDLDLIREVLFTSDEAEVRMVLTTPFCPYGPMLINQIQSVSETAAEMPVKVTVLPDRWEPPPWLR
jgi:metal-sulfur cluster biosynthetic enzyme